VWSGGATAAAHVWYTHDFGSCSSDGQGAAVAASRQNVGAGVVQCVAVWCSVVQCVAV